MTFRGLQGCSAALILALSTGAWAAPKSAPPAVEPVKQVRLARRKGEEE